jgi:hypothetical protein
LQTLALIIQSLRKVFKAFIGRKASFSFNSLFSIVFGTSIIFYYSIFSFFSTISGFFGDGACYGCSWIKISVSSWVSSISNPYVLLISTDFPSSLSTSLYKTLIGPDIIIIYLSLISTLFSASI